jgi:ATP-dependent exoDNAse (exonuclease V) beta subunit
MFTIWLEASAGSGKTTFLLSKIKETNADNVMFITFSNTAADEIKNRTNSKIYSTTLHALAYKIILNKINKNIASQSLRYQAILKLLENEDFYQLIAWMLEENITLDEHIQEQIDRPSLKEQNAPNNLNNTEYIWEKDLLG